MVVVDSNISIRARLVGSTFVTADKSETKLIASAEQRATDISRNTSDTNSNLAELTKAEILQVSILLN